MKKIILILTILFASLYCFSQEKTINSKNLLPYMFNKDSIKGWSALINNKGELQITCIIDSLNYDKDKLYNLMLNYFVENYGDAKSVIQIQDKEKGELVGKGLYSMFFTDKYKTPGLKHLVTYTSYHILRIDVKNKKIRIILTVSDYKIDDNPYSIVGLIVGANSTDFISTNKIVGLSGPFHLGPDTEGTTSYGKKTREKVYLAQYKSETKAFEILIKRCLSTIQSIESKLKETPKPIHSDDW